MFRRCSVAALFLLLAAAGATFAQEQASPPEATSAPKPARSPIVPPRLLVQKSAEYSDYARKKKIQGSVLVGLAVDTDGMPQDIRVEKSLEPSLDKQAIKCVSGYRFAPATRDGQRVSAPLKVEVVFRLY
jgi:TonB family protein